MKQTRGFEIKPSEKKKWNGRDRFLQHWQQYLPGTETQMFKYECKLCDKQTKAQNADWLHKLVKINNFKWIKYGVARSVVIPHESHGNY